MTARCVALGCIALVAAVAASAASPATRNGGPPVSIAAVGDSITTGACTDSTCAERPQNSWSTGTNSAVDSHLLRLRAIWKNKRPIRAFNLATSAGATMADLASQARDANDARAQYVTIELGENDLCGKTTPALFR